MKEFEKEPEEDYPDDTIISLVPIEEDMDAHSCSANADAYGICEICGAVIPGTPAYRDIYGGE